MPRRFRNFLRKKKSAPRYSSTSTSRNRYSSDSSDFGKYEYGMDYNNGGPEHGKRWSDDLKKRTKKEKVQMHRSSRSLGDAEVNGRLITLLDDSMTPSEEDDFFDAANFVNRNLSGRNKCIDDDDGLESTHGMQALDRACVRLDGVEVYAIVSALTCATAINCFDNYNPTPLSEIVRDRAIFTLLSEMFYYLSGALGMMTGLHATLIFSLVTMYGRTALGIDRDDAFNEFFANTGPARFNGFWSFKLSLYCFLIQLTFLIGRKFFFEPLRPLVLLGTAYFSYTNLYCDAEDVLSAAGVIFSTTPTVLVSEDEDENEAIDRRANMAKMNKRSSQRKSSILSLSTRNFGVDTSGQRRSSLIFAKNSFASTPSLPSKKLQ